MDNGTNQLESGAGVVASCSINVTGAQSAEQHRENCFHTPNSVNYDKFLKLNSALLQVEILGQKNVSKEVAYLLDAIEACDQRDILIRSYNHDSAV